MNVKTTQTPSPVEVTLILDPSDVENVKAAWENRGKPGANSDTVARDIGHRVMRSVAGEPTAKLTYPTSRDLYTALGIRPGDDIVTNLLRSNQIITQALVEWASDKRWDLIESFYASIPVRRWPTRVLITILTLTKPYETYLHSRQTFAQMVRAHLQNQGHSSQLTEFL